MTSRPTLHPGFSTPEMTEIWTAERRVGAILHFEAALALGLAEAGVAPEEEAKAIAEACAQPLADPERILASTWELGTPLIAILDEVRNRLGTEEQRRWVHHGATTQDAVDTAQMLQARDGLTLLEESLTGLAKSMLELVEAHRHQAQIGRTFLQNARPTTFAMRIALWLDPLLTHIETLRVARASLPLQLGGPVGNRVELGQAAGQVVSAVARRLGLSGTTVAWHADRTRMWRLVGAIQDASRSLAKVALDVALLNQSEIAEVTVRSGGSSSMSDKRNPIDAILALAAADACQGAAAMITHGRPHELDRGLGSWHLEWFALPLVFHTAAAEFRAIQRLLDTLDADPAAMASRVGASAGELSVVDLQIDSVISRYHEVLGH
jgi:3-carboxy-cis,cis-muconate cycloisomerase